MWGDMRGGQRRRGNDRGETKLLASREAERRRTTKTRTKDITEVTIRKTLLPSTAARAISSRGGGVKGTKRWKWLNGGD